MKARQTKPYVQPAMDAVELETCQPLLANSGGNGGTIGSYETINEGDDDGWYN